MELSVDRAHLATPETSVATVGVSMPCPRSIWIDITVRGEIAYLPGPGLAPADPFGEDLPCENLCRFDVIGLR